MSVVGQRLIASTKEVQVTQLAPRDFVIIRFSLMRDGTDFTENESEGIQRIRDYFQKQFAPNKVVLIDSSMEISVIKQQVT